MAIRVVHWGTGTAGTRALRCILNNPALELVGLYVARPERAARDAGSFVDLPDCGIKATNDLAELLAIEADCLCYMGGIAKGGVDDFLPFLRAGRSVVTAFFFPDEALGPVREACLAGNSSFFIGGSSPGFATDFFPMAVLGIVSEIKSIRTQELADYSVYPVAPMARLWGFGAEPGTKIPIADTLESVWQEMPRALARRLGVEIEEMRGVVDTSLASRDIDAAFYTIRKGTVANVRFQVQGLVKGEPFVTLEHVNYCELETIPEDWPRPGVLQTGLAYRTVVEGWPNITAEIALDFPIAAMRVANAIPAIVQAPAGVVEGFDVPPLNGGKITRSAGWSNSPK